MSSRIEVGDGSSRHIAASTGASSKDRIKVDFNLRGQPVGKLAPRLSTVMGGLVRTHAPIKYKTWHKVPKPYKDDIWDGIQREYEIPNLYRKQLEKMMSPHFKGAKRKFRALYYDTKITEDDKVKNVPPTIKPEDWQGFCKNEADPKAKLIRKKNKENRAKSKMVHTSGRHSYAVVEDNMKKKAADPAKVTRAHVWVKTHTKKDESVPESVAHAVEEVNNILAIQATTIGISHSLENDALTQLFGKDTHGHVRGVGGTLSRTQYEASLPATMKIYEVQAENIEVKNRLSKMEEKMDLVLSKMDVVCEARAESTQQLVGLSSTQKGPSTSVGITSSYTTKKTYELLAFDSKTVIAIVSICMENREVCHQHHLNGGEEKVTIIDIFNNDAPLYLGTQAGATCLGDVGCGGIIVWLKGLIKGLY